MRKGVWAVTDPFILLGVEDTVTEAELRRAYHQKAMACHPDQFQDEEARAEATRRMVALNRAYEEALQALENAPAWKRNLLSCGEAVTLANQLLKQGEPENALHQMLRATSRDASWYATQGAILMAMDQFESAEQSYREAVRMDAANIHYRAELLKANEAYRNSRSISGRLRHLMRKDRH